MAGKIILPIILGIAVLAIAGFSINSFDSLNESEIISQNQIVQIPKETTVEPVITNVSTEQIQAKVQIVEVIPVSSESFKVTPTTKNSESFDLQENIIKSAFAIPASQLTVTIDEWTVPTSPSNVERVAIDSMNNVFFTEEANSASKIGRLDPSTNVITEWGVPNPPGHPIGIAIDNMNNVYFGRQLPSAIGRLDPSTNVITEWTIPSSSSIDSIAIDSMNNVYFTENFSPGNKIGRLDPSTNVITEWTIPTSSSGPRGIAIDSLNNVYFAENNENKIGKMS